MNESTIKLKIFLYKSLDWVGLVGVLAWGVYATIHAEHRPLAALLALIALGAVNQVGRWTFEKVAILQGQLKKMKREEKLAEQRSGK